MRPILVLVFLFLTNQVFSQKKLFDTLKIDATTKIIGRYPQYDTSRTYEKYNFIIEDSIQIRKFIKNIKLGDESENSLEDPSFELTVVKNHEEIGSWTINPTLGSAMTHDGHTYKFDLNQIKKLASEYPFGYYYEIKTFKNKDEYKNYLAVQKNNPHFLFDYPPLFKYEGSFEVEFKESSKFSSPKAISDYLEPYIEKIVSKNEYDLAYILDSKNLGNREQYTMTISGPKKLFNELRIANLKNENWKPTVEEAYLFYKK